MNTEVCENHEFGNIRIKGEDLLTALLMEKPNDRSELDRNFAIAITDVEKLNAWIWCKILRQE